MTTKDDLEKCPGCKEALKAYLFFNRQNMRHKIICDDCSKVWGSVKVEEEKGV